MYLQKTESTYGRMIAKPESESGGKKEEAIDETPVPIQDQIENLRTKINLKERYNKVISEELEESRQGASSILFDLYSETRELREQLFDSLNAEKTAVQNALRTHRVFQLAMTDRPACVAISWLQDVLFDACKKFNALLCYLAAKRKKLEEAESMVVMIEKWPRPGTLPWELDAIQEFIQIENKIESVKVKLETATILHSKYYEIKFILREEGCKYLPTLKILENQVENHRKELTGLKKMLVDANKFLEDAKRNQALTEREAYDNRKERRRQMGKMKKAVDKLLTENANRMPTNKTRLEQTDVMGDFDWTRNSEQEFVVTEEMLKAKNEKIEIFQERARRLVDSMRVVDLTQIPARLNTVRALGEHLVAELTSKEKLKDVLLKQKQQLHLIQCHFKYTGAKEEEAFLKSKAEAEAAAAEIDRKIAEAKEKLGFYGNISVQLRLSVLGITQSLDQGKKKRSQGIEHDLKFQLRHLHAKFNHLIKQITQLEGLFGGKEAERDYTTLMRPQNIPPRLVRVGSPVASDDSDDDEVLDSKVPTRQQIKNKGKRVIQQAILRRGLK